MTHFLIVALYLWVFRFFSNLSLGFVIQPENLDDDIHLSKKFQPI